MDDAVVYGHCSMTAMHPARAASCSSETPICLTLQDPEDAMSCFSSPSRTKLCSNEDDLSQALSELPQTLYETFDRIQQRIGEQSRQYATDVLTWLTFARRPLGVKEVEWVIAFSRNERSGLILEPRKNMQYGKEEIFRICSSLVKLVESPQSPNGHQHQIQLAHATVKDYLVSQHKSDTPRSWFSTLQPEASHKLIAQASLAYLSRFSQPGDLRVDDKSRFLETWSLAPYAVRYWPEHARLSKQIS
jgi:hypothetical protein